MHKWVSLGIEELFRIYIHSLAWVNQDQEFLEGWFIVFQQHFLKEISKEELRLLLIAVVFASV